MVFQDPTTSLNPAFTVGDQIAEVLRTKHGPVEDGGLGAGDRADRPGRHPEPAERAKAYPHELSGGMAQRIAIARALSCNPKLLIADEPTTALDVTVQQEILDLFRDLQDEFGMAILFVTHDLAVAADICDRIAVMYAGEIVEVAPVDELFARPRHPYTAGLLAAMPHARDRDPPLPTIRGTVPRPGSWPAGCRFSDRCSYSRTALRAPYSADRHATGWCAACARTNSIWGARRERRAASRHPRPVGDLLAAFRPEARGRRLPCRQGRDAVDPARRDRRPRRRIRLRQVVDRQHGARARAGGVGLDPFRRHRALGDEDAIPGRSSQADTGGLPGSVLVAQPVDDGRGHRDRAAEGAYRNDAGPSAVRERSNCWNWFRFPKSICRAIRTSSRAGSGSASPSPRRWRCSRS